MEELNLEQKRQLREMRNTKQYEMSENLVKQLENSFPDIADSGLDAMSLLDALGCEGLSLCIGEWASLTYISRTEQGQNA